MTEDLAIALALQSRYKPAILRRELRDGFSLTASDAAPYEEQAHALATRGCAATWLGRDDYPTMLAPIRSAPPVLFSWGNQKLLRSHGVGMCGSRHASDVGLRAAADCGREVVTRGLSVVSGYARGVDTETHLAALDAGGATVIVLAEGIDHWRIKKQFRASADPDRMLVLSQFSPSQRWTAGAAMSRNLIIAGFGMALVVVEAGETGGTLNAGLQALKAGRSVLALEFAKQETPEGNRILIERGAVGVRSRAELASVLADLAGGEPRRQASGVQPQLFGI